MFALWNPFTKFQSIFWNCSMVSTSLCFCFCLCVLCLRLCKCLLWWSAYSVASNTVVMLTNAGSWIKTDESKLKDVFSLNEMIHGVLGTLFTPFFIQFTSLLTLNLEKPNYWIQWIVSNTIKYTNLSISFSLTLSYFVSQWMII